jgi:methyl-accepting chemotaxis protein
MREMAEVLREVDHNAKDLITSTEETTYSMSRLDSFLQDMASNGRDLESSTETANRVALEGTKVVGEMGKENEAIITSVKQAASAVEDLGRWSQEVGKIVEVIRDIADETNLLALNAAIIAAQSGEHGKAFGVVAEEIRGLAERTSSSTKEISDLVKAVQKNVANVVTNMKKSLQRVERGELLTRNAGMVLEKVFESFESSRGLAKQIATSTFEHKIDSSHVVRSLHKVADIARRIEEHNFSKWAAAGETLATARVLKALSRDRQEGAPVLARQAAAGQALVQAGGSLPYTDTTGHRESIISGLDKDIDRSQQSLKNISESLSSLLSMIEETASLVRSAARDIPAGKGPDTGGRCWEVTGCPEEIRQRCGAYTHTDWRCFLSDGTACSQGEVDDAHGRKECPECLAFPRSAAGRTSPKAD